MQPRVSYFLLIGYNIRAAAGAAFIFFASILRVLRMVDGNVCASHSRILRVVGGDTIF